MKGKVNGVTIIYTVKVTIVQINRELIYVHLPEWVEGVLKVSSACLKTPVNP
jgi:hypothetical protein